jgi:hypothetical protein
LPDLIVSLALAAKNGIVSWQASAAEKLRLFTCLRLGGDAGSGTHLADRRNDREA